MVLKSALQAKRLNGDGAVHFAQFSICWIVVVESGRIMGRYWSAARRWLKPVAMFRGFWAHFQESKCKALPRM
jgi:hypothetical protein